MPCAFPPCFHLCLVFPTLSISHRISILSRLLSLLPSRPPRLPAEEASVLPYTVRGCAAWDSREGWLILFDQFTQLQQFASE